MKRVLVIVLFIYSLTAGINAFAQNRNLSGSITASSTDCSVANSCVVLLKSANDGAVVLEITGSFTGTLNFEGSVAYTSQGAAATWLPLTGQPDAQLSGGLLASTTTTGRWLFYTTGLTGLRIRASAMSGTASLVLQAASLAPSDQFLPGATSDGVTGPNRFVAIGGNANPSGAWVPIATDNNGQLLVNVSSFSATPNVFVTPFAPASGTYQTATHYLASAASTNSTNIDGSTGNIYNISISNTTTTTYYLRMYNQSTAPTCSSSTNFVTAIPIPAAAAAGQVGGREMTFPVGWSFTAGIGFCITGGASSTDNTNAATGIYITVVSK